MNRICDTVSAVLAITIDATPSALETPQARSRCALSGSPVTAVGVRLFTASPAMRAR